MRSKTTFICCLPEKEQDEIAQDIKRALKEYPQKVRKKLLDEALSGRICDVEDLIDIRKYIN